MTTPHFRTSSAKRFANSRGRGRQRDHAAFLELLRDGGRFVALVISAFSLCTMSAGVPPGANTPTH